MRLPPLDPLPGDPDDPAAIAHRLAARTLILRWALKGQVSREEAIELHPDLADAIPIRRGPGAA